MCTLSKNGAHIGANRNEKIIGMICTMNVASRYCRFGSVSSRLTMYSSAG